MHQYVGTLYMKTLCESFPELAHFLLNVQLNRRNFDDVGKLEAL